MSTREQERAQQRAYAQAQQALAQARVGRTVAGYTLIPAGRLIMGSPPWEADRIENEGPQHAVELTRDFWMKTTQVAIAEWSALMGSRPAYFDKGAQGQHPVEQVNWFEAVAYANRLSEREGLAPCYELVGPSGDLGGGNQSATFKYEHVRFDPHGAGYRLATEAEWEYACRVGSPGCFYGEPLEAIAWANEDLAAGASHPVGQKQPNAWGLHDMVGNVSEWVGDWYDRAYYAVSPLEDPLGPDSGSSRVLRGGGWNSKPKFARAAYRSFRSPTERSSLHGFRLARTAKP